MYKSDYDDEPCGVKLVRLINTQSLDIAKREIKNTDKMCLYGTGDYWTGFEQSAYFLTRIFGNLESFIVNNPNYPFAIVGVSVPEKKLKQWMKTHFASRQGTDYLEFPVNEVDRHKYGEWHTKKVKDFNDALYGGGHTGRSVS